jgi:hypothetical protein
MKTWGIRGIALVILNLGTRGEWLIKHPSHFTPQLPSPGENCGACGIGGWVCPRASLDVLEEKNLLHVLGFEL